MLSVGETSSLTKQPKIGSISPQQRQANFLLPKKGDFEDHKRNHGHREKWDKQDGKDRDEKKNRGCETAC